MNADADDDVCMVFDSEISFYVKCPFANPREGLLCSYFKNDAYFDDMKKQCPIVNNTLIQYAMEGEDYNKGL